MMVSRFDTSCCLSSTPLSLIIDLLPVDRFITQIIPVQVICHAKAEDLGPAVKPLLAEEFKGETSLSYHTFIKRRNNKSFDREVIQKTIGEHVPDIHTVTNLRSSLVAFLLLLGRTMINSVTYKAVL